MSDNLNIYFLGTSSSTPTKNRNLTSMLIKYKGKNYLFDTPENVQQQIMKVGQSILKINNIFITHLHGDHFFGIVGLLATMQLNQRINPLYIYIPFGYKLKLLNFIKSSLLQFSFKINILEIKSNKKINFKNIVVTSIKLDHSVLTYGYNFKIKDKIGKFIKSKALKLKIPEGILFSKLQSGKSIKLNRKTIKPAQVMDYNFKKIGKSISYMTDSMTLKKVPVVIMDSDILIHEACFVKEHVDRATETMHSVSEDVGKFAKKANVKKLYLIHISSRYSDKKQTLKESKKYFKNSFTPNDLDSLEIKDY